MAEDWYRKKRWTKKDEDDFFLHLQKAQKSHRAQYLKVQAIELTETGNPKHLEAAEKLLMRILSEYPEDTFNKSLVFHTLGRIHLKRNESDSALDYYEKAIEFEKNYPTVKTEADLDFAELSIELNRAARFDFIEEIITNRLKDCYLPEEKLRSKSILTFISEHRKKTRPS